MTGKGFGKNRMRKEKIAILAASGFVLAALTMTGVYMSEQNQAESDDGYTVDLEALEESVENKNQEIAQNQENQDLSAKADKDKAEDKPATDKTPEVKKDTTTKDTKKTETKDQATTPTKEPETGSQEMVPQESAPGTEIAPEQQAVVEEQTLEAGTAQVINSPALDYAESEGLVRPLNGEAILPFSMESSIYFQTLDQYKYNPAMVIAAEPGTSVLACADGQVSKIYESRELGNIVEVDLGNGYTMTYGQLQDICVTEGSYIVAGSMIARIAKPSIYYTTEGSNLYLQLEKDGEPINPEPLFQ